jgi:hypothetical protein
MIDSKMIIIGSKAGTKTPTTFFLSPLLICATYGSIQSVRKPDTAYIQCPPEDERCDARNMWRSMI